MILNVGGMTAEDVERLELLDAVLRDYQRARAGRALGPALNFPHREAVALALEAFPEATYLGRGGFKSVLALSADAVLKLAAPAIIDCDRALHAALPVDALPWVARPLAFGRFVAAQERVSTARKPPAEVERAFLAFFGNRGVVDARSHNIGRRGGAWKLFDARIAGTQEAVGVGPRPRARRTDLRVGADPVREVPPVRL